MPVSPEWLFGMVSGRRLSLYMVSCFRPRWGPLHPKSLNRRMSLVRESGTSLSPIKRD